MGASWAVAASMSTDYWTHNLNSPWNYNIAGMAAAATHHALGQSVKMADLETLPNYRRLTF